MADRFISPAPLPLPYDRELLTVMVEECSEVMRECFDLQQRALKALRFGATEVQPEQEHDNAWRMAVEFGELWHVIDRLVWRKVISRNAINQGWATKAAKLPKFMQTEPDNG